MFIPFFRKFKYCLNYLVFTAISLGLFCIASANPLPQTQAFSNKTVNDMLATQFPIEKKYEDVVAIFSEPEVDINVLDKTVEIAVLIQANYQQQSFTAKGIFVGHIEYFDFNNKVLFKRPVLEHFYMQKDDMADSLPAQKVIKQSMSRDFRDFVLIDLNSFDMKAGLNSPNEIEFSLNKIIVHWN